MGQVGSHLNDELKTLKDQIQELKGNHAKLEKQMEEQTDEKYHKLLIDKETELNNAKNKINELEKQNESLKKINDLTKVENKTEQPVNKTSHVSAQRVDQFVDTLLADKDVNIKYLPDFVERQIYRNVIMLLMGLVETALNSSNINFIGHKLTFDITPDTNNQGQKTNDQKKDISHSDSNEKLHEQNDMNSIAGHMPSEYVYDGIESE